MQIIGIHMDAVNYFGWKRLVKYNVTKYTSFHSDDFTETSVMTSNESKIFQYLQHLRSSNRANVDQPLWDQSEMHDQN